jgi:hypothetical protein
MLNKNIEIQFFIFLVHIIISGIYFNDEVRLPIESFRIYLGFAKQSQQTPTELLALIDHFGFPIAEGSLEDEVNEDGTKKIFTLIWPCITANFDVILLNIFIKF